jgi:alpha-glucosidase
MEESGAMSEPWWRDAVIYQIYPRSFADSNGDGIGDLPGIVTHLDHVVELGADAIWLNPIYPSGGVDGGYDVTDYRDVDPAYGTLEDFDRLVEEAHGRGLQLILDFVPNHTSDRHPWFVESRASRHSAKRDWYVWADGKDGGPPNNWISTFTGSAWQWDERTGQFYLASFYPQQCDLNWHNPNVRTAMTDATRFWVERGVDGFRLDVVQGLGKDRLLRDNPPRTAPGGTAIRRYDQNMPETHDCVRAMRDAVGPDVLLLGEVWMLDMTQVVTYIRPQELDLAFNFPFAMAPWNARVIAALIDQAEDLFGEAGEWPVYHIANHDMPRPGTRWGERAIRPAAVMLLTLRGTPQLYQGEEIGMVDGIVQLARRHDRVGRDGCRTPMQWDSGPNAGFCPNGVEPWLPIADPDRNVANQRADPDSTLALYRRLLALRRASPALSQGSYRPVGATRNVLLYLRELGDERFLVAISFGEEGVDVPAEHGRIAVASSAHREGEAVGGTLRLEAGEAVVVRLATGNEA